MGLGGQLVGGFGWANEFGFFLPPLAERDIFQNRSAMQNTPHTLDESRSVLKKIDANSFVALSLSSKV